MIDRSALERAASMASPASKRFLGVAVCAIVASLLASRQAAGQVAVTATRTNLLYSLDANPDCSALSKMADEALPFFVTRIKVEGAPAVPGLRYRWSMPKGDKGSLAADLDLGSGAEQSAVSGMCADFGSACLLTEQKLAFYNEKTILWVAPTCAVLPSDTSKQFHGGRSHVRVKVLQVRRQIGRGVANLDWGKNGALTLYVSDMENPPRFQNGIGRHTPIPIFANPTAGWKVTPPNPGPAGSMSSQFGGGGSTMGRLTCADFEGCEEVFFPSAGRFLFTLTLFFEDRSALCDNVTVRVATCAPKARLEVVPKPKLGTYDPQNPNRSDVDLTVRLHNISKPEGGLPACPFLLRGAGILSCASTIRVGSVKDTRNTTFDLAHCSQTPDQPCSNDVDCDQTFCATCKPREVCLTQPHCSGHLDRACGNEDDCRPPTCMDCMDNETCIRVLQLGAGGELFIPPGHSEVLFHQPVRLKNVLADQARITDNWTANVFIPGISASHKLTYAIRPRPTAAPAP
jgi:hypothetical protein